MKFMIFLITVLCAGAFSDSCKVKSETSNIVSATPEMIVTDTRTKYLSQHWIHSYEEQQQNSTTQIFRPIGYKDFPLSRFRMEYNFKENGECEWYYLSPDDNHRFKKGKWKFDPKNKDILQITKDDVVESYKIIELNKDRLEIAELLPKSEDSDMGKIAPRPSEVTAEISSSALIVTNNSTDRIYIMVLDSQDALRTEWIPASDEKNGILPGTSTRIPRLENSWPSEKVIVFWWNKGNEIDGVQEITVTVK